jgi:acetyl/propionyl-CoA carboxylase alpha subunit
MKRRIDLLDEHYTVTVFGQPGEQQLQVADGEAQPAALTVGTECQRTILLGKRRADIQIAIKGETAYIRAFDRAFTLRIIDPVEQAAQEAGGSSNTARAPMPGTIVEVQVAVGEAVTKGQPMTTIESMKILMVITAPRDGEVSEVHFEPGDTFDKNAALVTLKGKEEE